VERPSEKAYVLESTDDDHFHWWEMGRTQPSDPYLTLAQIPPKILHEQVAQTRHSGGAIYLFADWHVKWAHLSALWGTTQQTNAFWP
jgi:prepilin-type processing-associated H-X9-DG protein